MWFKVIGTRLAQRFGLSHEGDYAELDTKWGRGREAALLFCIISVIIIMKPEITCVDIANKRVIWREPTGQQLGGWREPIWRRRDVWKSNALHYIAINFPKHLPKSSLPVKPITIGVIDAAVYYKNDPIVSFIETARPATVFDNLRFLGESGNSARFVSICSFHGAATHAGLICIKNKFSIASWILLNMSEYTYIYGWDLPKVFDVKLERHVYMLLSSPLSEHYGTSKGYIDPNPRAALFFHNVELLGGGRPLSIRDVNTSPCRANDGGGEKKFNNFLIIAQPLSNILEKHPFFKEFGYLAVSTFFIWVFLVIACGVKMSFRSLNYLLASLLAAIFFLGLCFREFDAEHASASHGSYGVSLPCYGGTQIRELSHSGRALPISLPLARHRICQRLRGDHEILLAIRNAAVIFAPSDFAGIGREIGAGDMMMLADFGAAKARKEALGLVRARAFV